MIDHKRFLELVKQSRGTINDTSLFCSNYTMGFFNDIARAIVLRFDRKKVIKVNIQSIDDEIIAKTDGERILINVNNQYIKNCSTRLKKFSILKSLFSHEIGHILFTNFRQLNILHNQLIQKGFEYRPNMMTKHEIENIYKFLNTEANREQFWKLFHEIENRIEDGHIEQRVMKEIPGYVKDLNELRKQQLNNLYSFSDLLLIKEINKIPDNEFNVLVLMNLILTYSKYKKIKAETQDFENPVLKDFVKIIPYINKALEQNDSILRINMYVDISYILFPYLKQVIYDNDKENELLIDKINSMPGTSSEPEGSTKPVNEGHDERGETIYEENNNEYKKKDEQITSSENNMTETQYQGEFGEELNSEQTDEAYTVSNKDIIVDAKPRTDHEVEFKTKEIEELLIANGEGNIEYLFNNTGNNYYKSDSDIERILESIAQDDAKIKLEEEETIRLNKEMNAMDYTDIHKKVNSSITRIANVPNYLIEKYENISPPLLEISNNMQKSVLPIFKSKRSGRKERRLLMGTSLNAAEIYKGDGKCFEKKKRHSKKEKIAVCYIGDESISMSKADRITYVRASAIIFEDFCRNLDIPHMIYGHSTVEENVKMYSYAEFEAIDNNNRYRIMDMACRGANRDGYVINYCAEKLSHINAENKILIIVCDGKPNHTGYSGSKAEQDVRTIVNKYRNKGIKVYALAIGDDKDTLKRMYGNGYVDITNLKTLPLQIINIIRKNIK